MSTAEKLHMKLKRIGYIVSKPERVGRLSQSAMANGAWSWLARAQGQGRDVGSVYTMAECLNMSDEQLVDHLHYGGN